MASTPAFADNNDPFVKRRLRAKSIKEASRKTTTTALVAKEVPLDLSTEERDPMVLAILSNNS
jgi:hypothetical protein